MHEFDDLDYYISSFRSPSIFYTLASSRFVFVSTTFGAEAKLETCSAFVSLFFCCFFCCDRIVWI